MPELPDELTPAIGYIRVSMLREEAISPELQRSAIQDWARRTGHRIVDWVEDLDKTGRNFRRRIMGVIERVESGEVKAIAVWKYSRFGRTRTGVSANLARVEKAGGQLISATEQLDARTAIGRFQRGMIMEFNAFESDRAGEQWMETHQWRRDHGLPAMGRPRFGYIWHQRRRFQPDGTVILQEERYEPDAVLQDVVAQLYTRYIAGEPFHSLALWLNDEGHRTVRDEFWTGKAVKRYTDSGFAAGYLRFHLKTCPEGSFPHECENYELTRHPTLHHPAIISDDTWRQYQDRRDFTKGAAPRARTASYPLTGLVRCGICENSARRSVGRKKGHVRYVCLARAEKGGHACPGTGVRAEVIETAARDVLAQFVEEIEGAASREGAAVPEQRHHDANVRRRTKLEETVSKLERSISRHMRVYAMAEEDDSDGALEKEYLATLRELRAEKSAATKELAKLRDEAEDGGAASKELAAVVVAKGLLAEWDTLPSDRMNVLLRRVVARIVLKPGNQAIDIYPAWGADPWRWTDPGAGKPKSKSAAVLAERAAHPGASNQEIADRLAREGVVVSVDYVRLCVSRAARLARARGGGPSEQERIHVVS